MSEQPFVETPLRFDCAGESIIGVLAKAAQPAQVGVVIVVGGPQYRVGSHRQFVLLARALAAAGWPVLRFDHRGIGDSEGEPRGFEAIDADIAAAIDTMHDTVPGMRGVVLFGLCDAASALMMYAPQDRRVLGLALANPWARGTETYAKAQLRHYYFQRFASAAFWRKVLSGQFRPWKSLSGLAGSVSKAVIRPSAGGSYRERMLSGLKRFKGRTLWLLSGNDLTAQEFLQYAAGHGGSNLLQPGGHVARLDLASADHTFARPDWQREVESTTIAWLASHWPRDAPP